MNDSAVSSNLAAELFGSSTSALASMVKALERAAGGIGFADHSGTIRFGNQAFAQHLNGRLAELIGTHWLSPISNEDRERLQVSLLLAQKTGQASQEVRSVTGKILEVNLVCEPSHGIYVLTKDVTDRVVNEDRAQRQAEMLREAMFAMHDGVIIQSPDGAITFCNRRAEEILGLSRAQMEGRTSLDPRWKSVTEEGKPFEGNRHPAMLTLRDGLPRHGVLMGVEKPNGELTWISINSVPIHDGVMATFADKTSERKLIKELEKRDEIFQRRLAELEESNLAMQERTQEVTENSIVLDVLARTDALTGLPNRRSFDQAIAESLAAAPTTLVMIDVDHFKSINDEFGHAAGDEVLRILGSVLSKFVSYDVTPARYGGEELALIIRNANESEIKELLFHLRGMLTAQAWPCRPVTVSMGVAFSTVGDATTLQARADNALYASKANGRDRITFG